jgi:hypothetical protein
MTQHAGSCIPVELKVLSILICKIRKHSAIPLKYPDLGADVLLYFKYPTKAVTEKPNPL